MSTQKITNESDSPPSPQVDGVAQHTITIRRGASETHTFRLGQIESFHRSGSTLTVCKMSATEKKIVFDSEQSAIEAEGVLRFDLETYVEFDDA